MKAYLVEVPLTDSPAYMTLATCRSKRALLAVLDGLMSEDVDTVSMVKVTVMERPDPPTPPPEWVDGERWAPTS